MPKVSEKVFNIFVTSIFLKKVKNKFRDLTVLTGSNTTLTIYYTFNILSSLILFVYQQVIHTKSFLQLINCLCNIISLLLFQITSDHGSWLVSMIFLIQIVILCRRALQKISPYFRTIASKSFDIKLAFYEKVLYNITVLVLQTKS